MKSPKIYVISDTHFNHKAILNKFEFRREDYEWQICKKVRKNLREKDILIHL